jgi:hypothetical protein
MPALAACEAKKADYTGADAVVDELRDIQRTTAELCSTLMGSIGQTSDGAAINGTLMHRVRELAERIGATSSPAGGSVNGRLLTGNTSLAAIDTATSGANTKLAGTLTAALTRGQDATTPLHVTGGSGGGGSTDVTPVVDAVEASGQAAASSAADLRTDLWFVAGLLASGLFGYGLYRLVMPRA